MFIALPPDLCDLSTEIYTNRDNFSDICLLKILCKLKLRVGALFVTQFVHNKPYKFPKKYKTDKIYFEIVIILL